MNRSAHLILALSTVGLLAVLLPLATGTQPEAWAAGDTLKVPADYAIIQAAIGAAGDRDKNLGAPSGPGPGR